MTEDRESAELTYHYPYIDLENKQVKGVVTVNQRLYLSASVDLSNGMIHVEKNAQEFADVDYEDMAIIEQIQEMAEFIISNELAEYSSNFLN